ncbi:MAG: T9SS type A sorting domain-containing protein [Prolixibacteraceae bacterium]|nr:T9SS type A sorting domain-containing protein [Prolixibacteraceae bacterium]
MRKLFAFCTLFLLSYTMFGQENCYPLYFEDAAGNRDTVWFGDAPSATFWLDEHLGEVNLINEPVDSVFEVFFTDAVTGGMYNPDDFFDCYLDFDQTPSFITKTQFVNYYEGLFNWFELGMIAKNWPVTISWDQDEMVQYVSELGNPACNLYLYSWSPPVSLIGDVHCVGNWPNDYTLLNETSQVVVDSSNFGHYSAPTISSDSVNLFFIYYSRFSNTQIFKTGKITCRYFSDKKILKIFNLSTSKLFTINLFDGFGKIHLSYDTKIKQGQNAIIDIHHLEKGFYIVSVSSLGKSPIHKTQKILIK